MRVCLLNHDLKTNTGAGRFCLSLIKALKEIRPENEYRVITHESVKKIARLRRLFRGYDIVHALDGWPYGVIAVLATRGLGVKVVITAIGTGAVKPLYQPLKKHLLKWAYQRADAVTAISNNTRREILRVIPDLDIKVINHGVDYEKFQLPTTNYQLPTDYKPYILSVGALKKRKGFEYSIAAFAKITDRFPDLKYVIVGSGPEREALKLQLTTYNLQHRVVFLNNISEDELRVLYQNAELFILLPVDDSHDIEGFGLVFLEAAAGGLPVIGTRQSGAEDAVLHAQNGFLVPPGDSKEAARAIERILTNRDLRQKFSVESKRFAESMNWEKAAQSYSSIYEHFNGKI